MEGYGKQLLVVDDNQLVRQLVSIVAQQAGYQVEEACDGIDALDHLNARSFDVVLTDYHMPRMNGSELLRICHVDWPDTPVIMVSSGDAELEEEAVRNGAYAWIPKPFDCVFLLETIGSAVSYHATAPARPVRSAVTVMQAR